MGEHLQTGGERSGVRIRAGVWVLVEKAQSEAGPGAPRHGATVAVGPDAEGALLPTVAVGHGTPGVGGFCAAGSGPE